MKISTKMSPNKLPIATLSSCWYEFPSTGIGHRKHMTSFISSCMHVICNNKIIFITSSEGICLNSDYTSNDVIVWLFVFIEGYKFHEEECVFFCVFISNTSTKTGLHQPELWFCINLNIDRILPVLFPELSDIHKFRCR